MLVFPITLLFINGFISLLPPNLFTVFSTIPFTNANFLLYCSPIFIMIVLPLVHTWFRCQTDLYLGSTNRVCFSPLTISFFFHSESPLLSPVKFWFDFFSFHWIIFITGFVHKFFTLLILILVSRAARRWFVFRPGPCVAPAHLFLYEAHICRILEYGTRMGLRFV